MFHLKCLQHFHVQMLNYTIAKTLKVFTYVHVTCKIQEWREGGEIEIHFTLL